MRTTLLLILLATILAATHAAAAETMKVTVKDSAIREECRFFAKPKVLVHLGDELVITGKASDWYRVRFKGTAGCVHKGALESTTISATGSGSRQGGASANEVALAGKGFSREVENALRKKNPRLDFASVDAVERVSLDEGLFRKFIEKGGLTEP